MKVVSFIFARGGSKGLPGKNIRTLGDKPLIAHSITFAKSCSEISDVIISTDCPEIAKVGTDWGATVPFLRPEHLSQDTSPEMEAWRHAVEYYRSNIGDFDVFLSLPAVSPLRRSEDVPGILKVLETSQADFVMSATESDANPYANLIEKKGAAGYKLCSAEKSGRRQDAPKVYRIIPMYYACRVENIFKMNNLFDGKVEIYEIDRARAVDVDTLEDFKLLQYLHQQSL